MDITKQLKDNFTLVNKAFFDKEDGFTFLRVEVNLNDLDKLTTLSRKINDFVDNQNLSNEEFYLDIFSSGTENEIDKHNLQEYVGRNIIVQLKIQIKDKDSYEGELLETGDESIVVRWNAKGQFRKQPIEIKNIKQVNSSAKVRKMKR